MKTEMTTYKYHEIANKYDFIQSEKLRKAATDIAAIGGKMATAQSALAVKLKSVSDMPVDELKADGFDGVGDFAEKLFNIGKSAASQLVTVATRFYDKPRRVSTMYAPYTLYILRKFEDETLDMAIDAGELTPDMTQAQVKAWVESMTENDDDEPKVLPTYKLHVEVFTHGGYYANDYLNVPMENPDDMVIAIEDDLDNAQVVERTGATFKPVLDKWKGRMYAGTNGYVIVTYQREKKHDKKHSKVGKKLSTDELLALLRERGVNV